MRGTTTKGSSLCARDAEESFVDLDSCLIISPESSTQAQSDFPEVCVQPTPILDMDDVPVLPLFQLYPLVDQIADKVVAMYEKHGAAASNRYRDLIDLTMLITIEEIEAQLLIAALRSRQQHARNPVVLSAAMQIPGPGWPDGYRAEANRSSLPAHLHQIDEALAQVGSCLNPILNGRVTAGRWIPSMRTWQT